MREEGMAGGGDRPKGGDGEKTKAKVRREGHRLGAVNTVLGAAGSADGGRVGGETLTVSVMRLDVGGGGDVKRLDLDHGPDAWRVEAENHNVRRVVEKGTRPIHPHSHAPPRVTARPAEVRDDAVRAKDGLQDGGEGLHRASTTADWKASRMGVTGSPGGKVRMKWRRRGQMVNRRRASNSSQCCPP